MSVARAADVAAVATVFAVAFGVSPVEAEGLPSPCAVSAAAVAAVAAVLAVPLVSPDEVLEEAESDASVAAVAAEVALAFVASDKPPAWAAGWVSCAVHNTLPGQGSAMDRSCTRMLMHTCGWYKMSCSFACRTVSGVMYMYMLTYKFQLGQ